MAKAKSGKSRTPKKYQGVDALALAEIVAASIEARSRRGLPITREQERAWTPDVASALDRHHLMRFYNIRGTLFYQAQDPNAKLSVRTLAIKAGEVLDDRQRGRPQAIEPSHGGVTVIFNDGLDPNKLPDAPKSALPKEANARVVLPKKTPGSQPSPTFPRTAVDGPRTDPEVPDD